MRNEIGLSRLLHDEGYVRVPAFPHERCVLPASEPGDQRVAEAARPRLPVREAGDPARPRGRTAWRQRCAAVLRRRFGVDVRSGSTRWRGDEPALDVLRGCARSCGHAPGAPAWQRGRLLAHASDGGSPPRSSTGRSAAGAAQAPRGFPEHWSARARLPIASPSRLGVVVHVFYPELAARAPARTSTRSRCPTTCRSPTRPAQAITVPADMGPLAPRAGPRRRQPRSRHPPVGQPRQRRLPRPVPRRAQGPHQASQWRAGHELAATATRGGHPARRAARQPGQHRRDPARAFAEKPDLGLVTADGSVLGPEMWGDNQARVANLLRRVELPLDEPSTALRRRVDVLVRGFGRAGPARAATSSAVDFEPEPARSTPTTAHAVERDRRRAVR